VRGLTVLPLAIIATSCGQTGTKVDVTAAGTFTCGEGFHGCIAWFVVRPVSWSRPANWEPGKNDGQFSTTTDHHGTLFVEGRAVGGPSLLEPGEYRFSLLHSEVDDTNPLVLGTDEQATTGLLSTTADCDATFVVDRSVATLEIGARFGAGCSIDFQPKG
jgi:hypothetical protein